jgi:autotransporter-associated beta strand protein
MKMISEMVARRRYRMLSVAALSMAATADISRATLTTASFTGSGYSLITASNYSPSTPPSASILADVTGVESNTGGFTSLSVIGTGTSSGTSVTLGAIAFDTAAGSGIYLDSTSTGSLTQATTLTLAGGNTGTAASPLTLSGDLITLTSNVGGLVNFRGLEGGITLDLPSTGGNFDVTAGSTLEFDATTALVGTGSINLNGAGTVLINNAESGFTTASGSGGFVISNGTLAIAGSSSLDLGKGTTTTISGGALDFMAAGNLLGSSHPVAVNSGQDTVAVQTGSVQFAGLVSGAGTLVKAGPGTLFIDAYNNGINDTYSGGIVINGGAILFQAGSDLGATGNSITLNGGTLAFDGLPASNSTITLASTRTFVLSGAGDIDVGTLSSGTICTMTVSGNISGAGSLTKTNVGTLVLGTSNSFTGGTTIDGGTLAIAAPNEIGNSSASTPDALTFNGGALAFTGASATSTSNRPVYVGAGGGTISVTNAATVLMINGAVAPAGSLSTSGTLNIFGPGETLFQGSISGIPLSLTSTAVVNLEEATPSISSLTGASGASLILGYVNAASPFNGNATALTIGSDNTSSQFAGVISDRTGTTATSIGSIIKLGTGTLTLSASNTYTGSTTVNGGTLSITGALINSGTINVNNASNLVLAGAAALPSAAIVNVGSLASTYVSTSQAFNSLASAGNATFTAGTSIVGQGSGVGTGTGTTGLTSGGITGTGNLTVNGTANVYASTITQNLLTIGSASTVTIADSAAPGNTSAASVLTDISNSGTLDLNNNDLIVLDTTQYTTVRALIENAYDGGAWDKPGITSSSARANAGAYGLGYAQASTIGSTSFDGQTFADAVLVKYTLLGDTQLRGTVGIGDYDTVLSNYGTAQDWSGGDFHYGGVVGIGDYDDVLSNYGAHASGNIAVGPSLTRSIRPAASLSPDLAKTDLKLEVNTSTGDVYVLATASAAFTGYTISDPTAHLLGGSTSPDPDKLLSVAAGNGGNTNVYESSGTYVDWFKITETASQVAEGQQQNGFGTHSSRDDTINIPAGGTIDFGDIYNTVAAQQDLTFDFAEAGTEPTNGPTYYGAEVDYISSSTPEPGSVSLVAVWALGMLAGRRRKV